MPPLKTILLVDDDTDIIESMRTVLENKGYRILVTIDEKSYSPFEKLLPFTKPKDIRMGADHPMVWTHCVGDGRAFYSALGHAASTYGEPLHRKMIGGAIAWAAGLEGPRCVGGELSK